MKIDWDELKDAFTFSSSDMEWYLDLKTGRTLFIGALDPEAGPVTPEDLEAEENRYLFIEVPSSHEAYEWMAEFVEGIEDEKLADKLRLALDGKGAFHLFKNVLLDYPEQREAWFEFEDSKINAAVEAWVKEAGIAADNPPPWKSLEKD